MKQLCVIDSITVKILNKVIFYFHLCVFSIRLQHWINLHYATEKTVETPFVWSRLGSSVRTGSTNTHLFSVFTVRVKLGIAYRTLFVAEKEESFLTFSLAQHWSLVKINKIGLRLKNRAVLLDDFCFKGWYNVIPCGLGLKCHETI